MAPRGGAHNRGNPGIRIRNQPTRGVLVRDYAVLDTLVELDRSHDDSHRSAIGVVGRFIVTRIGFWLGVRDVRY